MATAPNDSATAFASGFAFGLFGNVLGVGAAAILSRDRVPGAVLGAVLNTGVMVCLGVVDFMNPGSIMPWMAPSAPAPEPPPSLGPATGPSGVPAAMWALLVGGLVATMGLGGAIWMWLGQPDPESEDWRR